MNNLKSAKTLDEALNLSGLNWEVGLKDLHVVGSDSVLTNHQAVVRLDNLEPLGVVKRRYEPVQNKDFFACLEDIIQAESGVQYHLGGAIKGGAKVVLELKLPDSIRVIGDDIIEKYLTFVSSHDGSYPVKAFFTPVRMVCLNQLRQIELDVNSYLIHAKHTKTVHKKLSRIGDLFLDVKKREEEFKILAQQLVLKQVTEDETDRFIKSVLGMALDGVEDDSTRKKNQFEEIKELGVSGKGTEIPGVRGSAWGLYNAVTEYGDHFASIKGGEVNRYESKTFGNIARLKDRALVFASALAGIK